MSETRGVSPADLPIKVDWESDQTIGDFIREGLTIDGAHHKQWYLEVIGRTLGVEMPEDDWAYEPGIPP